MNPDLSAAEAPVAGTAAAAGEKTRCSDAKAEARQQRCECWLTRPLRPSSWGNMSGWRTRWSKNWLLAAFFFV